MQRLSTFVMPIENSAPCLRALLSILKLSEREDRVRGERVR